MENSITDAELFNCKVGKIYPKNCHTKAMVCNPIATSFGDECGVKGCKKIS